jgi:phosphoserine aminotransferase
MQNGIASISHRGKEFKRIYEETAAGLRNLLGIPNEHEIFFLSSATECWERILENCVERSSHHLITGAFGEKFYEAAIALKKQSIQTRVPDGEGIDVNRLVIDPETELIAVTQNESATGVTMPPADIVKLAQKYPDKLLAVDCVSSLPYVNLDYGQLDAVYVSVQKGFGLPAGLALLIVSPRAINQSAELMKKGCYTGGYRDFISMQKLGREFQTYETPNVLNIYLLNCVLKDMAETGIQKIREETEKKHVMLEQLITSQPKLSYFVKDAVVRSKTVNVISVEGGSDILISQTKKRGFEIGSGYGKQKDSTIRITNFPSHSLEDMRRLIEVIKTKCEEFLWQN